MHELQDQKNERLTHSPDMLVATSRNNTRQLKEENRVLDHERPAELLSADSTGRRECSSQALALRLFPAGQAPI